MKESGTVYRFMNIDLYLDVQEHCINTYYLIQTVHIGMYSMCNKITVLETKKTKASKMVTKVQYNSPTDPNNEE